MTVSLGFAITMAVVFMFLVPTVLMLFLSHTKWFKWLTLCLGLAYFCVLIIGVFGKVDIADTVSVSFENNGMWFSAFNFILFNSSISNFLINIFMFFPLAVIIFAFFKKHLFLKTVILAFCLSIFIETMQFVLPISRTVELTDIIFNTLSGIISFLYFYQLKILNRKIFTTNSSCESK